MLRVRHLSPKPKAGVQSIEIPRYSRILGFYANSLHTPSIYYLCDPSIEEKTSYNFLIVGEGWDIEDFSINNSYKLSHVGTCKDFRGGVWHCFQVL